MFQPPKQTPNPKIQRKSIRNWLKGTVTAFDDGRTPEEGLRSSNNLILTQDGTLRPRPSLMQYGPQPTGTILGEIYEFVQTLSNDTDNWMISVQNVAGTAKVYVAKGEDSVWTVANGKTYDVDAPCHFLQVDDKVLVMNGEDNLSYFDISTVSGSPTVVPFTALSTPGAPTPTKTGLATPSTPFTYYYRITANSTIGETAAGAAGSVAVSKLREQWDTTTNYVTVTWSSVASATSYNVYVGSASGDEFLIASGINALSIIDSGTALYPPDVNRPAPLADSTAGPKVKRAATINGQVFMVGDKDSPRYVRYGGQDDYILDFSPVNGGGWVELGRGSKDFPVAVKPFRDGKGNAQITVLCRSTNGLGKRYLLTPNSVTYGEVIIDFFQVTEDNGQDGTDSPDAIVLYNDSLWYPSRGGFKTTGTKPQLQNLLSTDRVSNTIQDSIRNLRTTAMDKAVGLGFEGRIYFALPVGSDSNNEIWVLDLDRQGAWMKPWNISAEWMWLYNDNTTGATHFCILQGNVIYEFATTYNQTTNDDGVAFTTSATSGLVKFSEDGMVWGKVIDVTFFVQRPAGQITVAVAGKTEDASLASVGTEDYVSTSSIAGWSELGWGEFGWSEVVDVPVRYGDQNKPVVIEVDETCQWITWEIRSTGVGVDFQLSDIVVRYVEVGVLDLE
jgi:hypothetical protein